MKRTLPPLKVAVKSGAETPEQILMRQRGRFVLALVVLALATLCVSRSAWSADKKEEKEYDQRLNKERQAAEQRQAAENAKTPEQKEALKKKTQDMKAKEEKQQNLAEYKEKTINNLASIKELDAKAEAAWKEKHFGEAAAYYQSIALASVPGSEPLTEKARGRMLELEDLAKGKLKEADDADLKREYVKEVELLSSIVKEFRDTKTKETAMRRLLALKSNPEVAGFVELAQAEALEADGKIMDALALYTSISTNPRYDHTIPSIKAARKLEEMNKNEATSAKIKAEIDARAEREAPVLISSAKNYVTNNMPKQAIEKLQQVVEKFPNTTYAEEARKQIDSLKN